MPIPVTLGPRTSMILDHASMNSLVGKVLKEWAGRLLDLGFTSNSVVDAVVNPAIPPEKLDRVFREICQDVGMDLEQGLEQAKEDAYIEEYRAGHFSAPHILHVCNRLRVATGFAEQLTAHYVYAKGQETVAYRGMDSGICGDELNSICLRHLAGLGIERRMPASG